MHKRIAKVVTASLMAAAMLTTTVATVVPMSVSAGLCVGETPLLYPPMQRVLWMQNQCLRCFRSLPML